MRWYRGRYIHTSELLVEAIDFCVGFIDDFVVVDV